MPTLNDLYYTFIGNVKLNPEYTTQYNVGITYNKSFNGILRILEIQADGQNRRNANIQFFPLDNGQLRKSKN